MDVSELRGRVAASPLRQIEIAKAMTPPMDRSTFSLILNGHLPIPDGFEDRLDRAIRTASEEKARIFTEAMQGVPA